MSLAQESKVRNPFSVRTWLKSCAIHFVYIQPQCIKLGDLAVEAVELRALSYLTLLIYGAPDIANFTYCMSELAVMWRGAGCELFFFF